MNLTQKGLGFVFALSFVLTLCVPSVFPMVHLFYFSPFLVILIYQKSMTYSLWLSLLCGCIVDLLSADTAFGLHAITYCLTVGLLYHQKKNFFSDTLSTLPLMTYLFSFIATLMSVILVSTFEKPMAISIPWVLTDLIYLPLADATFAFIVFIFPFYCLGKGPRKAKDYFLEKNA